MKIALVGYGLATPELRGVGSPVPELATALTNEGHEVVLMARRESSRLPIWLAESRFRVRLLAAGPRSKLDDVAALEHVGVFVRNLERELRLGGYDVVHSHGWLAGLATQLATRDRDAPVVHSFHHAPCATLPTGPGSTSRMRAERACALNATELIATSSAEQESLIHMGVRRSRITVIPPGVTTVPPDPTPGARVGRGRGRIVLYGPAQRVAEVMRAMVMLPGVGLTVCATSGQPHDRLDEQVTLAASLGIGDRVSWRLADTPSRRTALVTGAHLVVCMTTPQTAGTEHLEAMAHAVPVVAGDAPATEAVVDGVTGLHLTDLRPRALAVQLGRLLADPIARQHMAVASRDRAITRYNWPRIAGETTRVYDRMVTPAPIPAPRHTPRRAAHLA